MLHVVLLLFLRRNVPGRRPGLLCPARAKFLILLSCARALSRSVHGVSRRSEGFDNC